jgi:arachidonate 15-lipoxygenase (second type)/8-lipoxygenase (S-type)/hydroperoxy icosatetraenoate dehydratase/isomerase
MTYTSLCIRDDIKERGLESVPDFYYREDGFQMWDIINR